MKNVSNIKIIILILVSLLIWTHLYGSLSSTSGYFFDTASNSNAHDKSPSYYAGNDLSPLLPLQINKNNTPFAQNIANIGTGRIYSGSGSIRTNSYHYLNKSGAKNSEMPPDSDTPDTVFKFINTQTHQYLDIPPPYSPTCI